MALYDRFQSTASKSLKRFKQGTIKLIKITTSGDEWNPTPSETPHTQNATAFGVAQKYIGMETGGGVVVASDGQVMAPADGQVPTTSDKYEIDGERYQILQVEPVPLAGTVSLYRCIVRK